MNYVSRKVALESQHDSNQGGIEYIERSEHQVTKGFSGFSAVVEVVCNYPTHILFVFGSGSVITQAAYNIWRLWILTKGFFLRER